MTKVNMHIIVGLGNPGEKYKNTRHNAGFMAIDKIVKDNNLEWKENKKFNALFVKDNDTLYLKPLTFMNNSGTAVQAVLNYYKIIPKKLSLIATKNADLTDVLTVIHDDIDIEFGKIKESTDSRSAGHKGVESIINLLKTKDFKRIRIGVKGSKPEQMATKDYVLSSFNIKEMAELEILIKKLLLN